MSTDDTQHETVYEPRPDIQRPAVLLAGIARDIWTSRGLAWRLFLRNLRGQYRQTLLGLLWAFLPPLANTAIWIFLRKQGVFQLEAQPGVSDVVYILTGMILWQAFIDALQMPQARINENRGMVSKLNFPRESLLMEGLGDVMFNFAIRALLLVPAFWWYEVPLSSTILLFPVLALLLVLLGFALGLILFPIGSLYQDVGRLITLVLPFWMILTPIIYVLPETAQHSWLVWANPAAPLLMCARDMVLSQSIVWSTPAIVYGVLTLPLVVWGLLVFRISMPILVERMTA